MCLFDAKTGVPWGGSWPEGRLWTAGESGRLSFAFGGSAAVACRCGRARWPISSQHALVTAFLLPAVRASLAQLSHWVLPYHSSWARPGHLGLFCKFLPSLWRADSGIQDPDEPLTPSRS